MYTTPTSEDDADIRKVYRCYCCNSTNSLTRLTLVSAIVKKPMRLFTFSDNMTVNIKPSLKKKFWRNFQFYAIFEQCCDDLRELNSRTPCSLSTCRWIHQCFLFFSFFFFTFHIQRRVKLHSAFQFELMNWQPKFPVNCFICTSPKLLKMMPNKQSLTVLLL